MNALPTQTVPTNGADATLPILNFLINSSLMRGADCTNLGPSRVTANFEVALVVRNPEPANSAQTRLSNVPAASRVCRQVPSCQQAMLMNGSSDSSHTTITRGASKTLAV